jgi:hypothetical protein
VSEIRKVLIALVILVVAACGAWLAQQHLRSNWVMEQLSNRSTESQITRMDLHPAQNEIDVFTSKGEVFAIHYFARSDYERVGFALAQYNALANKRIVVREKNSFYYTMLPVSPILIFIVFGTGMVAYYLRRKPTKQT